MEFQHKFLYMEICVATQTSIELRPTFLKKECGHIWVNCILMDVYALL